MYFVIYAAVVLILVLTKVLTVHGAWLLGIPCFLICFAVGSFIRLVGFVVKYEEMEEELNRLSKKLEGGGEEKFLSGLIRVGSFLFGPTGGMIGNIVADLIDDGQESKEALQQKYSELFNFLERKRTMRNWSIVMMFLFTAGIWTLKYLRLF